MVPRRRREARHPVAVKAKAPTADTGLGMVLRLWHLLVVFGAVVCLSVGFAAGMLASGHKARTSTVVQVLSVAGPHQEVQDESDAKANVRASIPAIEAFNADNTGAGDEAGYAGLSIGALQTYDSAIVPDKLDIAYADSMTYCVQSSVGKATWHKDGPGADIVSGGC